MPSLRSGFLLSSAAALLSAGSPAAAATVHVPGGYATIQAAIDSSATGDTVLVQPGTYVEQLTIPSDRAVIAEVPRTVTLDANRELFNVTLGAATVDALLQGLHLIGAANTSYGFLIPYAVVSGGQGFTIQDCVLESGVSSSFGFTLKDSEMRGGWVVLSPFTTPIRPVIIQGCVFDGACGTLGAVVQLDCGSGGCVSGLTIAVRHNVFRNCRTFQPEWPVVGYSGIFFGGAPSFVVEDNLFVGNSGPAVGLSPIPIINSPARSSGNIDLVVRRNTIVDALGYSLGAPNNKWPGSLEPGVFEANVVTGAPFGIYLPPDTSGIVLTCNDVWNNDQNWTGTDLNGLHGNFSADPVFCNIASTDYTIAEDSPCLPANNSCGVQIGAFGPGCQTSGLEPSSWARIKAAYR